MPDPNSQSKLIQYIAEAHATERALVTNLVAHIAMTPRGDYRSVLERHLGETRRQARDLERRLGELGGHPSSPVEVVANVVEAAYGAVQNAVAQALVLTKGPLDLLRGTSAEEKLVKNAKDECATEALEIATYDALEALARALGDDKTADLAVRHREEEEKMLADLRELIPALVRGVTGDGASFDASRTGAADAARAGVEKVREVAGDAAERTEEAVGDAAERTQEAVDGAGESNGSGPEAPWSGYDNDSAADIRRRLQGADQDLKERVREYERENKDRVSVLRALEPEPEPAA